MVMPHHRRCIRELTIQPQQSRPVLRRKVVSIVYLLVAVDRELTLMTRSTRTMRKKDPSPMPLRHPERRSPNAAALTVLYQVRGATLPVLVLVTSCG